MFKFRPSFNCIKVETQFYFPRVKILNFLSLPYLGWVSCYHDILAGRVSALFHRERSGCKVTETLSHLNVLCIHALDLPICLSLLTRYWALEIQWWSEEHSLTERLGESLLTILTSNHSPATQRYCMQSRCQHSLWKWGRVDGSHFSSITRPTPLCLQYTSLCWTPEPQVTEHCEEAQTI